MDERRQEQAGAYALGILPENERAEFEAAMLADAELRRLVADFADSLGETARMLPPATPGAELRGRVLAAIAAAPSPVGVLTPRAVPADGGRMVGFPSWIGWAAAAAFALMAGLLAYERAGTRADLARLADEHERERLALVDAADRLRDELAVARRAADLAQMRVARLETQLADQPGALAVSLWNHATQEGVLLVENLALPPPGKTYQLWVIDPSTQAPIDAGIFTTDADGRGRMVFRPKSGVQTAAQFAVSLEAAGGAASPQGPIVMIGPATQL